MEQRQIQRKTPLYKLPIYPEHFQLFASDTIILFQMFVLTFGNLVLAASNLSKFNPLNWIVIKYYDTLFALQTSNCLDNFTTIITALSNVFGLMVREFVFVLIQVTVCSEITFNEDSCHLETSQLIFNAMQLFGFYMTQHIEENYRAFCGFLNVNLFAHLCF